MVDRPLPKRKNPLVSPGQAPGCERDLIHFRNERLIQIYRCRASEQTPAGQDEAYGQARPDRNFQCDQSRESWTV